MTRTLTFLLRTAVVIGACAAPAVAAPLHAAEPRLPPGVWTNGSLSGTDAHGDGRAQDSWTFDARSGQVVRIWMSSSSFDTRIMLGHYHADGQYHQLDSDDDGGDGTNSFLEYTPGQDETLYLVASSFGTQQYGGYSVFLDAGQPEGTRNIVPGPTGRTVFRGQTQNGWLDSADPTENDRRFEDWTYTATSASTVLVRLNASGFDPYVEIGWVENGRFVVIVSDDDSGEGANAQASFNPTPGRQYRIRARAYAPGAEGSYTLRID